MKVLILLLCLMTFGCLTTRPDSLAVYRGQIQQAHDAGTIDDQQYLNLMGNAQQMQMQREAQEYQNQAAASRALMMWGFQKSTESPYNRPTNIYLYDH